LEQIFKYFVVALFAREESLGARRHFAIASFGVRQVPFFEIRSLNVVRSIHEVSEVTAVAGVGVLKANVETNAIASALESQRKSDLKVMKCNGFFESLSMGVFLWTQR
jgi:hypothetical protein